MHPFSIFDSTVNRVHSKGTTYDVDLVLGASLAIFLTICNNSVILTTLSYHVACWAFSLFSLDLVVMQILRYSRDLLTETLHIDASN